MILRRPTRKKNYRGICYPISPDFMLSFAFRCRPGLMYTSPQSRLSFLVPFKSFLFGCNATVQSYPFCPLHWFASPFPLCFCALDDGGQTGTEDTYTFMPHFCVQFSLTIEPYSAVEKKHEQKRALYIQYPPYPKSVQATNAAANAPPHTAGLNASSSLLPPFRFRLAVVTLPSPTFHLPNA